MGVMRPLGHGTPGAQANERRADGGQRAASGERSSKGPETEQPNAGEAGERGVEGAGGGREEMGHGNWETEGKRTS